MTRSEAPMIGGTYPAMAYVRFDVSAGKRDFSVLAPAVTQALEAAGLSVTVYDESLSIAGGYEAQLPAYHMDRAIWDQLTHQGYELESVTPVRVRNVSSGGQHGAGRARMYMYEELSLFVARGEGSDKLMDKIRTFARDYPDGTPDFDQIVKRLLKPEHRSQRWAPLMSDTRDIVGRARFTGRGVPEITYLADSMVAMKAGVKGFEYIPILNADGSPRYVETWTDLIRS